MTVILFNSVLIVLLLGFIIYQVRSIWDANNFIHIEIKKVLNDIQQQLEQHNTAWCCDITTLIKLLREIHDDMVDYVRDVRILDKLKELDKPFEPMPHTNQTWPPCYTGGPCTNPQMDCINCPKRGTGGTWSTNTSIKAEDAPLQERFNDSKED